MVTRLLSLTIVQKLNLSFVTIVVCVIGLVAFSVVSVSNLKTLYSEYREKARLTLLLSNLSGGLADARLGVLKYRITGSTEAADAVNASIQSIAGLKTKAIEVVTDQTQLQRLQELEGLAIEYGQIFNQATEKQAERHRVVGRMDELGPDMRKSLTEIMESAYADGDPDAAFYAGRSQQSLMLARYYARNFLIRNELEDADRTNAEINSAEEELQVMLKELQNPRRRELAESVIAGLGEYRVRFAEVVEIISERNKFYFEGLDKIGPEILGGYSGLYAEVENTQNELGPETVQTMENIRNSSLIVGIVIGVLALAIATLMSRAMSRSFKLAIDQMTRLSEGDKSFEIEGAERGDEIGDISRSLEVFRTNAIEVDRLAEESRKAEEREQELAKRQEKERRQAILDLANTFEDKVGGVVRDVETASVQLQEMASSLSATVGQTRTESASVATASQDASSNVQTVAAAAEEMTASIREISSNVAETASTTKNCTISAEDSKNRLSVLQKSIDEIDSVISSINDVAEQTNLLALNATIEAARAGDAGKGFAVVATEVKSLANATHKMTEEISEKVGGIKGSAESTIESVNSIIDQITNIDERTSNVAAAIEEQSASTEEISRNVQNAASGTSSVSTSIELVQQATDNSAQSTEQLESAANQLSAQSQALNSSVEEFLSEVRAG